MTVLELYNKLGRLIDNGKATHKVGLSMSGNSWVSIPSGKLFEVAAQFDAPNIITIDAGDLTFHPEEVDMDEIL